MIVGAHIMLQSKDEKADKAFLSEVLDLPFIDAGGGFLIFGTTGEIAIHESDRNDVHQLFLMCEDMDDFLEEMAERGIAATQAVNRGWGTISEITLPGGGKLSVYEPHHKRPAARAAAKKKATKKRAKKAAKNAKKPARKKAKR